MSSRYERETIINYNEEESTANIFTASPTVKTKLAKLGEVRESGGGWEIDVPKSWIKISPPKKLSDTQLKAAKENIKKANLMRKKTSKSGKNDASKF